ncbi:MAG: hypothetical protein Q9184_008037 [Pyrenodesmia sp. 2 TL-2023]
MAEQTKDRTQLCSEILQAFISAQSTPAVAAQQLFLPPLAAPVGAGNVALKYPPNVLNERIPQPALRLYPVFRQVNRIALHSTLIPRGGGPDGISPIYVRNGTMIYTAFDVLHQQQSIRGADAKDFKPGRWETPTPDVGISAVWRRAARLCG